MTAGEWKRKAVSRLAGPDADWDARLFLTSVLSCELSELRFREDEALSEEALERLDGMLKRRLSGEPEQYIEGAAWFMGHGFYVDKRVLIPRQDTETLCETALELIKCVKSPKVLDLCAGSGCLGISIALARPDAAVTEADISPEALEVVRLNAEKHGVKPEVLLSDGFDALRGRVFDLIVCNPPYLTGKDMDELQEEVRFEPALALDGGEDGLKFYRRFIAELPRYMSGGGAAVFEAGIGQAESILGFMRAAFPAGKTGTRKDLNGIERAVFVRI